MIIGITGSRGFIGRNLVKHLINNSINFIELDWMNIKPEKKTNLDHIIHLASKTSVQESWNEIPAYMENNVNFTTSVLELAKQTGSSVTICSSYGANNFDNNQHLASAPSPYHLTKLFSETLCSFYNKNFDVPIGILKLANVYGIGQKKSFLIPTIIQQVINPEISEIVVNTLSPRRNFIDVRDVVEFIVLSLPQTTDFKRYYVGSLVSYSVEDVIKKASLIAGIKKTYRQKLSIRKNEIDLNLSSLLTSVDKIDWEPKYSFDEGLKNLIDHEQQSG